MYKIIVIIITYNAKKWIDKCIGSTNQSTIPLDVLIVDNGSTDGTQNHIKTLYPNIIFKQNNTNLGFGKANNIGMQYAIDNDYDYIYLLNQDAWLMPATIEKLVAIHKSNPQYGILSPYQLQANMEHIDKNFGMWVCSWDSNKDILEDLYFKRKKEVYAVPEVMAAHWLISKECLFKVGGFSPTFPHYGEDNNYANRTWYHGYKVGIVPNAIAVHDREYRKESTSICIYKLAFIRNLILLSSIHIPSSKQIAKIIWNIFETAFRFKSFLPFKYCFLLISRYSKTIQNMRVSKSSHAFLS